MATTPTVDLTYFADTGIIRIVITAPVGVNIDTLTRTDAAGSAVPVRTREGLLPTTWPTDTPETDRVLVIEDHEFTLTGTITYHVTGTSSTDPTRPQVSASIILTDDGPNAWLTVSQRPVFDTPVELVTGYEASHPSQTTPHTVIGRTDPLATIGVLGARRGTLTLWCSDYARVRAIMHVYSLGMTVLFRQRQHQGLDLYHLAIDSPQVSPHQLKPGLPIRWQVSVPYIEVNRPGGPLSGSALWTFDQVRDTYASFTTLPAEFDTFDALEVGPLS